MLFYCRLKVNKMRIENNFWLMYQPMGSHHEHTIIGMIFAFIGKGLGVAYCDWRRYVFKEVVCQFCCHDSSFLLSKMCHQRQTTKCCFLVLKTIIQKMAAHSALQAFVITFIIFFPYIDRDHFCLKKDLLGQKTSRIIS